MSNNSVLGTRKREDGEEDGTPRKKARFAEDMEIVEELRWSYHVNNRMNLKLSKKNY